MPSDPPETPTILCATDLTEEGGRSLDLACAAARGLGAIVLLVHVADSASDAEEEVPDAVAATAEALKARLEARHALAKDKLDAEVERCAVAGISSRGRILSGRPWEAIVQAVEDEQAALVVLGRRADRAEGFVGPTIDHVVRHAACPVLVSSPEGSAPTLKGAHWIVGVDFSRYSTAAVRAARAIVDRCGGTLSLLNVGAPSGAEGKSYEERSPWQILREEGLKEEKRDLDALLEREAPGAQAVQEVSLERPSQVLCDAAERLGADIIAVGTHGRAGLARLFLGSTADRLLRRATLPVLVLRESPPHHAPWFTGPEGSSPRLSPNRILVAVDFSDASRRALELAHGLSVSLRVAVEVVHVFEHPMDIRRGMIGEIPSADAPDEASRVMTQLTEKLCELVAEVFGTDSANMRCEVVRGRPDERIIDAIDARAADLLVVGTTGRSGIERLLLGSVAEKLVSTCPVPVLTVH